MKSHQQWLDNRKYAHHLQCLKQIRTRKNMTINTVKIAEAKTKKINLITNNNESIQKQKRHLRLISSNEKYDEQDHKFKSRPLTSDKVSKITLNQRNLLWQNFLIGKRIIQTPPVICKKRHQQQYRRHQQMLRSRQKYRRCSNFRQKKLKQYNQNNVKFADEAKIHGLWKKNFILIRIKKFDIFKSKTKYDNLQLLMWTKQQNLADRQNHTEENEKKTICKHRSQKVSMENLIDYNFIFPISNKSIKKKYSCYVQLKEIKKLQEFSIGKFCFPLASQVLIEGRKKIIRQGHTVGVVEFQAMIGDKNQEKDVENIFTNQFGNTLDQI